MNRIAMHGWTPLLVLTMVLSAGAQVTDLDPTDQAGAQFGHSVANAGDVNGDGFGDVIVGAMDYQNSLGVTTGGAFLFFGSENGVSATYDWSSTGDNVAGSEFGSIVAPAGDVNNDGYADVLVGARLWSDGTYTNEGRVYLYLGSETGLSASADWVADPVDMNISGNHSFSVAGVGDVNGDGFDDVVLGSPQWGDTFGSEGRAYLYYGNGSGLSSAPDAMFDPADQSASSFGYSVAPAGDVNGDGYADMIVGAAHFSVPNSSGGYYHGRAYVYHGSPSGFSTTPDWFANGDSTSFFGWAVDSAGDVNGDGYSDVIVSARNGSKVYIYPGSPSGLATTPLWTVQGSSQLYAHAISGVGDFNGDGYGDVVVGSLSGMSSQGFLFLGGENGPASSANQTFSPGMGGRTFLCYTVSGAGDVNGDGFDELLVSAPGWEGEGRVSIYDGFDFESEISPITLTQFESDGVTPLATGAMAGEAQVALGQNLVNNGSMGGDLAIEIEIKPIGVDFDGQETQVSGHYLPSESAILMTTTLAEGAKHWRSRIVYPGNLGNSRWISYGNNSENEVDFEVPAVSTGGNEVLPVPAPVSGGKRGGRCGCTGAEALMMIGLVAFWRRRNSRKK